jgi:predicted enzyme related to lactoylglutathione lyase
VERARNFYAAVFEWRFEPWGPPDFYLIRTGPQGDRGLQGALQRRQHGLTAGSMTGLEWMAGFECTIGVQDLDAMLAKISEHGGHLLAPPFHIHGVGRLSYFEDTERNRVGVMQYDPGYAF